MNLRRKSKLTSEVSTSSLNDIMFFLLLFFLIASTMANPNVIKVLLPKAKTIQQVTKKPVNVTITKDLDYFIEKNKVSIGQLRTQLETLAVSDPELTVVLRIDSEVDWKEVVEILDMGKELNIKMVAATQKR